MVNLLLTGVAVSNVFDDNLELDSGGRVTVRELGQTGERESSLIVEEM